MTAIAAQDADARHLAFGFHLPDGGKLIKPGIIFRLQHHQARVRRGARHHASADVNAGQLREILQNKRRIAHRIHGLHDVGQHRIIALQARCRRHHDACGTQIKRALRHSAHAGKTRRRGTHHHRHAPRHAVDHALDEADRFFLIKLRRFTHHAK